MKRHVNTQVDYNIWANQQTVDLLRQLDEDVIDRPVANSFPTIRDTLKHIQGAESNWLQRIQLDAHTKIPWVELDVTRDELFDAILRSSQDLKNYVDPLELDDLAKPIGYISGEGKVLTQSLEYIIYHVINHSTYHRGQIITMLKQLGIQQAVSTDLFFYYQR